MSIKCSVIGHKYGETEVEREREEQGSEVVITIQERETCERCGKTRIVSENKEVTAIETPSDIAGDMLDDEDSKADEAMDADGEAAGRSDDGAVDPEADDAEILDDDTGASAGENSELGNPSTEVSVTEAEEDEPPLDAEEPVASDPEADDGMIIDGDENDSVADDRQPGEWPDEPEDDGDDWTPETVASKSEDDEESSEVEPFGGNAVTVPNGQFRCPECDFTTDVASSSLRAGDFCPECHKGALINTAE